MRITDLANKLGFTTDQLIELLIEEGINKTNLLDELSEKESEKIISKYLEKEINLDNNNYNKSSLKSIKIESIFNKYTFELKFDKDVNILVAENGSGKTTILNIIASILEADEMKGIQRLQRLPFKEITINEKMKINKDDFTSSRSDFQISSEILRELRDVLPNSVYRKIRIEFENLGYIDKDEIVRSLQYYGLYDKFTMRKIDRLVHDASFFSRSNKKSIIKKIRELREEITEEIIYFPTYRRVEEELENIVSTNYSNSDEVCRVIKSNSRINFGITDVEIILDDLCKQLRDGAAEYYREMTARVLEDLLNDRVYSDMKSYNIDKSKIDIVIGRIGEEKINYIDKLNDFINGNRDVKYYDFLYYYLNRLIKLYEVQKAIDNKIIRFKEVCNKYLLNKEVRYNEAQATVKVYDNENGNVIPWSKLSSGEKQIVSLFAKLYLNTTKPAIVIIDEPELSLSIFWQKTLLEDMYDSGKVALMIATTHSPFIYKNRFSDMVKDLDLFKKKVDKQI